MGSTGYLLRRCPDAGGSVGRRACFLACSSCEQFKQLFCQKGFYCISSSLVIKYLYVSSLSSFTLSFTVLKPLTALYPLSADASTVFFHIILLPSSLSLSLSHFLPPPLPPAHQHCLRSSLKLSGQPSGTGSCRLLLPTPQMIAEESTSL